jgi:hypothetical protein
LVRVSLGRIEADLGPAVENDAQRSDHFGRYQQRSRDFLFRTMLSIPANLFNPVIASRSVPLDRNP